MKKILLGLLLTMCMATSAFAVTQNINAAATFADPFTIDATVGAADFGTLYLSNVDAVYSMDISVLANTAAVVGDARTQAIAQAQLPTLTINGAANAAVVNCGYMVLISEIATLDLSVTLKAPITMTSGGATVADAPVISAISSNAFAIASLALNPASTKCIPLYVAPTITTVAALPSGTYQGTMEIELILN